VNGTGWSRGLEVTGGGTGVVSHAGLALLRQLADRTGLTAGLSGALARRLPVHHRGRVLADLACAIADGAQVISDFRVMSDQRELFGPVASAPTLWRAPPGVRVADKVPDGVACIRLDATVVTAHSDGKEGAEPNFKGFGHHPLLAYCDNTVRAAGRDSP